MLKTGHIPRAFAESCKVCRFGPQSSHRPSLTPISCQIRRFFEKVQDKSTNMDAPEPDWKYLSGFAVKKGRPETAGRGIANDLIARRRGPIMATK